MATVATIRADLVGSSASFQAAMIDGQRQANVSMQAIRRDVAETAQSFTKLGRAAAGLVAFDGLRAGVESLLEAQRAAQQIHFSLLSATGSSSAAGQAYDQVAVIANKLGLSLQDAESGFSRMSAAAAANGIAMRDQINLFDGLAKSSTVLHLSSTQTSEAILALSQMFGKGKIQAQELTQQLGNAIPGVVPRFQQAVMQMVKGTDLAGKSFQQLLQAGDLSVQRFLPALVTALNETGQGAEQAADGINASLNRLSTSWFKLKSDISSGLFSDVASTGLGAVSDHLEGLADAAGASIGLLTARYAGRGVGAVAGAGSAYIQQQQGARAAAQEELKLAQARSADVAEQIKATTAARDGVAQVRAQALESRQAAQAIYQQAVAQKEAAQATLEHQHTTATLSANIRAERDALAQATAAQKNLERAQAQYDAAVRASNSLKEQQIALEARLVEARAVAATTTEEEAAAEASLAATSARGLLARGAAGVGNFALGLVGGPIGAVIAGIGALGYAVYDYNKRADEFREHTQDQAHALDDLHLRMQQAIGDYGNLNAAMSFKQMGDLAQSGAGQLDALSQQASAYQSKIDELKSAIQARDSGPYADTAAVADWFDQQKINRLQAALDKLQPSLQRAQQDQQDLAQQMQATAEAALGKEAPAMHALLGALDQLGLASAKDYLVKVVFQANTSQLDQADQKLKDTLAKFQEEAKAWSDQAATAGLNNAQKARQQLEQAISVVKAQTGLTAAQKDQRVADLTKGADPAIQSGGQLDAAAAAKKSAAQAAEATRAQLQAYQNLRSAQAGQIQGLQDQLGATDKLVSGQQALNHMLNGGDEAFRKLSASQQSSVIASQRQIVQLQQQAQAMQQAKRDGEALGIAQENLARIAEQSARQRQDALYGIGHGRQDTQDHQADTELNRQYADQISRLGRQRDRGDISHDEYQRELAAQKNQLAAQLAAQRSYYAQRDAMQTEWTNGAAVAFANYAYDASNVAAQVDGAFTSAFSGMEDALVSFVQTGKLSFSSFVNSVIGDIARMEIKAAESHLLGLVQNSLLGGSGLGGASVGSGYALGASAPDTTTIAFGGGRAAGGATTAGSLYQVAEQGPELYQSGGRTYLLGGQDGRVTPAQYGGQRLSSSTGSMPSLQVVVNNNAPTQISQQQTSSPNGGLRLDIVVDELEQRLARRVDSGKSKLTPSLARKMGTTTAADLS